MKRDYKMLQIEASVDEAVNRIQNHAVSKGVPKTQAKHLASTPLLKVCTDLTAAVSNNDIPPINIKSRRKMLRGAQTHFWNAERKVHYWLVKRNLSVQEMNRRLVQFNISRCPKIFWDPITREKKEALRK
jgi:hypothetical protein